MSNMEHHLDALRQEIGNRRGYSDIWQDALVTLGHLRDCIEKAEAIESEETA